MNKSKARAGPSTHAGVYKLENIKVRRYIFADIAILTCFIGAGHGRFSEH